VLVFGITPFAIWGPVYRARCEPRLTLPAAIGLGFCHWIYSYVQCVAVWLAVLRLVRAKTDWQKTSRLTDVIGVSTTHRQAKVH
jgi:hypothetical protein